MGLTHSKISPRESILYEQNKYQGTVFRRSGSRWSSAWYFHFSVHTKDCPGTTSASEVGRRRSFQQNNQAGLREAFSASRHCQNPADSRRSDTSHQIPEQRPFHLLSGGCPTEHTLSPRSPEPRWQLPKEALHWSGPSVAEKYWLCSHGVGGR